jgi:hypothetical protein
MALHLKSTGIDFTDFDDHASMDAELLDDYEEGDFAPTFGGSGSGGNYGHAQNDGHYVKIGRSVTFHIKLAAASDATGGTGSAVINGIPFTIANDGAQIGAGIGFAGNWTSQEANGWRANPNTTQFVLSYNDHTNGYWYDVPASKLGNNSYLQCSGAYKST